MACARSHSPCALKNTAMTSARWASQPNVTRERMGRFIVPLLAVTSPKWTSREAISSGMTRNDSVPRATGRLPLNSSEVR